ncbi:B12-binding domain-containing radical SAM protein, partial [Candidatus Omnitrophota bacterium]
MGEPIEQAFERQGIGARYNFRKVLLVAPYGDHEGCPLKYILPHYGVEMISYRLLRETDDIDSRVYNANLGSVEELYSFVQREHFDIIGFSILQLALRENLKIIGRVSILSPKSLMVFGGYDLKDFPLEDLFAAMPCDMCMLDDGSSLIQMANELRSFTSEALYRHCSHIPNLALRAPQGMVRTDELEPEPLSIDVRSDIPLRKADITHGKMYKDAKDVSDLFIPLDRVGRNPLPILYGSSCSGNCIFCSLRRDNIAPPTPDEVIETVEEHIGAHDSINFDSADFLADAEEATALFRRFQQSPFASVPKKITTRVDSVNGGDILHEAARAGVILAAFGIESFVTRILKRVGKGTTREQNIRALDLTLAAGIRPGINLILFTPWDTIDTTIETMQRSLDYVERGAYVNVVPYINVVFNAPISKMQRFLEYEEFYFEGMKKKLRIPTRGKVLDPALALLAERSLEIERQLEEDYPSFVAHNVCVYSLLLFKAFSLALTESDGSAPAYHQMLLRVDAAIESTIEAMHRTSLEGGALLPVRYQEYCDIATPDSDDASSLRMEQYIESKFPPELFRAIKACQGHIEIHRAPQSKTEAYLASLKTQGYTVVALEPEVSRIRNYYRVSKGQHSFFVISNSIGYNRELFVVQVLKYYGYPEEKLSLRILPVDMRHYLSEALSSHGGKIKKIILAHEIETLVEPVIKKVWPGAETIARIKDDFLCAVVVRLPGGEEVLVCDIEYINGEHIKPILEFFASPVERRGLGAKEIILYAACGTLHQDVEINDSIVPRRTYKNAEEVLQPKENAIDEYTLDRFLQGVSLHEGDIFTIPTVISASQSLVQKLAGKAKDVSAIELEYAHAAETLAQYPEVVFRALYEVHDKPAGAATARKKKSLGKDVPGLKDPQRRKDTIEQILRYLLNTWYSEASLRNDAFRVEHIPQKLPTVLLKVESVVSAALRSVARVRDAGSQKPVIIGIAGLPGTGKSRYLSQLTKEALETVYAEDTAFIRGDRCVFSKDKQDLNKPYPFNILDIDLIHSIVEGIQNKRRIGFALYDHDVGGRPKLDVAEISRLSSESRVRLSVAGFSRELIPVSDFRDAYKGLFINPDSELFVEPVTAELIEVIASGKTAFILDVATALLFTDLRDLYDFSIFTWSSVETREEYLLEAQSLGQRFADKSLAHLQQRFERMVSDEDEIIFPTMASADVVFINDDAIGQLPATGFVRKSAERNS